MNSEEEEDAALTKAMLARMTQHDNAIQFGLSLNEAMREFSGCVPAFTIVFGMPDGTLTRFTNLEADISLSMLAETLRLAMENRSETVICSTATKQ